jgi:hypothetical protein
VEFALVTKNDALSEDIGEPPMPLPDADFSFRIAFKKDRATQGGYSTLPES